MAFSGVSIHQPLALEEALRGQWGFRLERLDDDNLYLVPVGANSVVADASKLLDPDATISVDVSVENLIAADASDSGITIATHPLTLLYVYFCSAGAAADSLGVSLTAPTVVNGVKVLGAAGDAARCLFVGYFVGDASGRVVDSDSQRFVVNHYNRRLKRLRARPGYTDGDTATTFSLTSALWAALNGGAGDRVSFIANGEDAVHLHASATLGAAAPASVIGVGILPSVGTDLAATWLPSAAAARSSVSRSHLFAPASAVHCNVDLVGVTGGLAATFLADAARTGASEDPAATELGGAVWA